MLAANAAGATVRFAEFDVETGELSVEAFEGVIGEQTRLVAVTAASNAIGTRPDVRAITELAHSAGALTYVDGVHATPHVPTDVGALGADFYACSSYKFFGPHAGCVIADPALLETVAPAKLAPSSNLVPWRFERGTPAFELLAGVTAAVDWIAGSDRCGRLTPPAADRRAAARRRSTWRSCLRECSAGSTQIDGVTLLGAPRRRTSTVSLRRRRAHPRADGAGHSHVVASGRGTATTTPTS